MMIYSVLLFLFLWDLHFTSTETVDKQILSTSYVQEEGSFTVTCDASLAGVPTTATTITQMYISWGESDRQSLSNYTKYFIYNNTYSNSYPPDASPPRNWTFNFSGSQQGTSNRPNNRNTIKIEMVVYDAKCTDDGFYSCNATYIDPHAVEISTYQQQYLTIRSNGFGFMKVDVYPQNKTGYESYNPAGSNVTLKCYVDGPTQLNITWKFGDASTDVKNFTPLNGSYATMVGRVYGACVAYLYLSQITFQTEDRYDGYMYVCVATVNSKAFTVGNMTIYTREFPVIVNPSVIKEGQKFTVTCDASRAGVSTTNYAVHSLKISWTNGTGEPVIYSEYGYRPYYDVSVLSDKWNWKFDYSGSRQDASNGSTMKIQMTVNEATCSDAGLYLCTVNYEISRNQTVTSSPRLVPISLTLFPQHDVGLGQFVSSNPAGSNVTLTCNVTGPEDLFFKWKYGKSSANLSNFLIYPVQDDISVAEPVRVSSGTTCIQYRHTSTLKFQTEDLYDGYMYVCMVTANNDETMVGNITIKIEQASKLDSATDDYNFLYYVVPVAVVVFVGVVWVAVCFVKVYRKVKIRKVTFAPPNNESSRSVDSDGYLVPFYEDEGYAVIKEISRNDSQNGALNQTSVYELDNEDIEYPYSTISDPDFIKENASSDELQHGTNEHERNQTMDTNVSEYSECENNINVQLNIESDSQRNLDMDGQHDIISNRKLDTTLDGKLDDKTDGEYNSVPTYEIDNSKSLLKKPGDTYDSTEYLEPIIFFERKRDENMDDKKDENTKGGNNLVPTLEITGYNKLYETSTDIATDYIEPNISSETDLTINLDEKLDKNTDKVYSPVPTHNMNGYLKLYDTTAVSVNSTYYSEPEFTFKGKLDKNLDGNFDKNTDKVYCTVPTQDMNGYLKLYDTTAVSVNSTDYSEPAITFEEKLDKNLDGKFDKNKNKVYNSAPTHDENDYLKIYDTTGDTTNFTENLKPDISAEKKHANNLDEKN